jgi:hypothetical protein
VLVAVLAAGATPAAATPVGGEITRAGGNVVRVTLTNTGSSDDIGVAVEFHPPVTVVSATRISGPPGNCAPDGGQPNRVLCLLDPPGLAPGGSIVIEVLTNPRVEDNAGANAFSCGIPCNTSMMSGPYAITGPPPPGARADLGVEMHLRPQEYEVSRHSDAVIEYDVMEGRKGVWELILAATTTNHGPDAAAEAALTLRPSGLPFGTRATHVSELFDPPRLGANCELVRGAVQPAPALCRYATFPSGAASAVQYALNLRRPGDIEVKAEVGAATSDPNPANNSAVFRDAIDELPDSDFGTYLRSTNRLRGKGRGGIAVFIGVLVLEGGARLGEPAADGAAASGPPAVADPAAAGCRWLTTVRVRFRREAGRNCNEPSFIRARVKRGRWSIKLRRALPRGRYTVITQALSRDGVLETGVGRKLGNLSTFRVR